MSVFLMQQRKMAGGGEKGFYSSSLKRLFGTESANCIIPVRAWDELCVGRKR